MMTLDGVEMVDVREAAALSRRTPETIRRWVWTGRLDAVKNGNKLFVRKSALPLADRPTGPMSLADWESSLPTDAPAPGASARDLVLEDRESRAGR